MSNEFELDDFDALRAARSAWGEGRLDEALGAFGEALRQRPHNVKALLEAARAFGQRHEVAEAERLLARAEALAGHNPRVAPVIAQAYGAAFRPAAAIARFERLRESGHRSPMVAGELARLYEDTGRLDLATERIDECVRLAPGQPEPLIARARIDRRAKRLDRAEPVLRELASKVPGPPLLVAEIWSELSYLYDASGRFDSAATAIGRAKSALLAVPQSPSLVARAMANNVALGALAAALDASIVCRWSTPAPAADPRCSGIAHLIGFPRSGTTLLEQMLGAHPGVADSPERVVFTRDVLPRLCAAGGGGLSRAVLDSIPDEALSRERGRYLDMMESVLGEPLAGRVHLDKNPNHTSLLPCLLRLFPESRWIVALRDPRDVVVSCAMRTFRLTEFSAAMLTWRGVCEMYAFEMGLWLRLRGLLEPASFVEIRYEDTVADPERAARRALRALGLKWHDDVLRYRELGEGKVVNSPTQGEVRQTIYGSSIGRWRHYESHLAPHMPLLEPFIDAFGYER